jgi:predicted flap endonuclease-1-like 5' DNA nuclease
MPELFNEYLPIIIVALVIGAITGFLLFRPRQRVRLSDEAPRRPHMTGPHATGTPAARPVEQAPVAPRRGEGWGIGAEAAAAVSDVAGDMLRSNVHGELPGASDDLQRLKGVGPKFATLLHSQGIFRFDQIARMTPNEVERIDLAMGSFRGRFARDRIVEQADYLARGDTDGYEQAFGKL